MDEIVVGALGPTPRSLVDLWRPKLLAAPPAFSTEQFKLHLSVLTRPPYWSDELRERIGNVPPRAWVILALNEWIGLPAGLGDLK
jgi:hypothetical protein